MKVVRNLRFLVSKPNTVGPMWDKRAKSLSFKSRLIKTIENYLIVRSKPLRRTATSTQAKRVLSCGHTSLYNRVVPVFVVQAKCRRSAQQPPYPQRRVGRRCRWQCLTTKATARGRMLDVATAVRIITATALLAVG